MKKPEELGYKYEFYNSKYLYNKFSDSLDTFVRFELIYLKNVKKYEGKLIVFSDIVSQKDIDNLQIAYNNLQRDLKELNKEKNNEDNEINL